MEETEARSRASQRPPGGSGGAAPRGVTRLSSRKDRWIVPSVVLIPLTALFVVVFTNAAFWRTLKKVVPPDSLANDVLLGGIGLAVLGVISFVLLLLAIPLPGRWTKLLLFGFLLLSASAGYFMDTFGVVLDPSMFQNVWLTDRREAAELVTLQLFWYIAWHALVPAIAIALIRIKKSSLARDALMKALAAVVALAVLAAVGLVWYKELALIGRQHREVRLFMNPVYPVYSLIDYADAEIEASRNKELIVIAPDARHEASPTKTVVVLVIGETARASAFHLNGYSRDTTPRLGALPIVNFTNAYSCGTSTAESLPCIFSDLTQSGYSRSKARRRENLLDVLQRSGVSVLWLDNNSGSQGIAARVPYEDLSAAGDPRFCNAAGCFDEVLLEGLEARLAEMPGDAFVVLHQKGSHGPAYYKRTPPAFKKFLPECDLESLQDCERQTIINAYDNTILYTDFFLAELIKRLGHLPFATAMIYVSDHGESLGENNIFLHGLPLIIAPDEQVHIPMVTWLSPEAQTQERIDIDRLASLGDDPASHDQIFHSVLGLFGVETRVYDAALDLFAPAVQPAENER